MTTHRLIQISNLLDNARAKASLYRRAASNAANIGNRHAAILFIRKAQKCDSIINRALDILREGEIA
jgi:hypothetical protein